MKKIDLHLHLSFDPVPKSDTLLVSTYKEMLPHLEELGIGKGVLMSSGERNFSMPMGSNEENCRIAAADPEHYAWMCNLDYDGDPKTVYDRLSVCKEKGAVGIGELMINRRLDDPFLNAVFEAAGKLNLPVTFHMSPETGYSYGVVDDPGLPLLEACLKRHPHTQFLGHSQTFWIEMSADAPTDKESRNQVGKRPRYPRRTGSGTISKISQPIRRPKRQQRRMRHYAGSCLWPGILRNLCRPAVLCHRYGKYRNGLSPGTMAGRTGSKRRLKPPGL